jgi:hypothetical protein
MKTKQAPKQEDEIEAALGIHQISSVAATDERREPLTEAIFSTYLGEKCKYCGRKYKTLEDLKDTVWAGVHKHGRLACKSCWLASHETDVPGSKHAVG